MWHEEKYVKLLNIFAYGHCIIYAEVEVWTPNPERPTCSP